MSEHTKQIDLSESDAEKARKMEAAAKRTIANGREFFIRMCIAEGIDPSRGVSPTLLKMIGGKQ